MHNLKWMAVPVAAVGLTLLFFGIVWTGAAQLVIAAALLALAAAIWRAAAASRSRATTDAP